MIHRRPVPALLALLTLMASAACATTGARPLPDAEGRYRGAVMVQGQSVDGTLELLQEGSVLTASFEAPAFGLDAEGQGMLRPDGTARLVLAYDLECTGEAQMIGTFNDEGTLFEGEIRAEDCTGRTAGTFSFRR